MVIRRMVAPYDCAQCGYGPEFHDPGGDRLLWLTIDQSGHEFVKPDSVLEMQRMRDNWREIKER